MKKNALFCLIAGIIASCSSDVKTPDCPRINIPRETARQYISDLGFDALQVSLNGSESYCYTDDVNSRRYVVITPIFKIRRMEDSSINAINTSFYVQPQGVGSYSAKQVREQSLQIPQNVREHTVKGKPIKLHIKQPPYNDLSINLGLNLSDFASAKSKTMFDIDYKYLSADDLAAFDEKIDMEYLEIGPDEKVVFCEQNGRPVVVKKGANSKPCD